MAIEKITTKTDRHPIKNYPFSRDGIAYHCTLCHKVWLKEKEAKTHECKPIEK
jgi:hypothetical protein